MKTVLVVAAAVKTLLAQDPTSTVVVASKTFTEAVVLGDIAAGVI